MVDTKFDYYFFKTIENTNEMVKKIFSKNKFSNIAFISMEQTNGKGRMGRTWISKKGDLTCTFLINEEIETIKLGQINIWFISKLLFTLKKIYPKCNFKIKWPNDIYLNEKKLGGVLIETIIIKNKIKFFIIGVGINLISSPNVSEYKTISISEFSNDKNPLKIFLQISKQIDLSLPELKNKKLFDANEKFLKNFKDYRKKIKIKINNNFYEGKFLGINDFGQLLIDNNNVKHKINYGDII
tara:strand:- start:354 stop:1076 length:723 start_codon:yes stop_codon:yes gene_type:complete